MNAKSLAQHFSSLPSSEQAKHFAAWMHALTIDARDTYIPGTQAIADPVRLRGINELQHRLAGQLMAILEGGKDSVEEPFVEMVCQTGRKLRAAALHKCIEKAVISEIASPRRQRRAG